MNAQNLGFMSSWRMLTRDKGWIKPVLILTLLGWIPVLGQIVVLGYALEWARLTAWGVDAAPKQRGIDYGKVLSTGGRAFLVTLSVGFVVALVLQVLFPGSLAWIMSSVYGGGLAGVSSALALVSGATLSLVTVVVSAFVGLFLQAAALRATLYDSFSAGWRLDRLFQMIARDFGGFCKTWLVSLIGGIIQGVYGFVVGLIAAVFLMGGVLSAFAAVSVSGNYMTAEHFLFDQLLRMGAGPLLLFVLMLIAFSYIGGVIGTAMTLVTTNAMGQWFCRFDVNRWGVSADPLPEGVPHRGNDWSAAPQTPPVAPSAAGGQADNGAADAQAAYAAPDTAQTAPVAPEAVVEQARAAAPVVDEVVPLDAPYSVPAPAVPEEPVTDVSAPQDSAPAAPRPSAQEDADAASFEEATCNPAVDEADAAAPSSAESLKKPIPLGPITTEDEHTEDGPIQA